MSSRYPGHSSRTSSSSTNVASPTSSGGSNASYGAGDVPTSVRELLTSTKDLQSTLRQWGTGQATEKDVSDIFVKVGTQFHTMMSAFAYHRIDLSHVSTFTDDLRSVLEQCLSEDPSQEALSQFMPEVRKVLYTLLKGLQARQGAWQAASGRAPFMSSDERP